MMNSLTGVPYTAYFRLNERLAGYGPLDEEKHIYIPPRAFAGLHKANRLRFSAPILHLTVLPNDEGCHELESVGYDIIVLP